MNIEYQDGDHLVLRLSRKEAEDVYAAMLVEMAKNSEEEPLKIWAEAGVFGATQLASQDLADRILKYQHFVGPAPLIEIFESWDVADEAIERVIVEGPADLETVAKIEGVDAYNKAYVTRLKQGI